MDKEEIKYDIGKMSVSTKMANCLEDKVGCSCCHQLPSNYKDDCLGSEGDG